MHELSVIENILKNVQEIAMVNTLKDVTKIYLKIGKLRHLTSEMLTFSFDAVKAGTIAQNAQLIVDYVEVAAHCNECNNEFEIKNNIFICNKCNSCDLHLISGKEVILESINGKK